MTPLAKKLSALGLPEKDAQVYLALLSAGSASVNKIARQTGINRSSLYVVLDRLMKLGFVSIAGNKTVRQYAAAPPERLALAAKESAERTTLLLQNLATLSPVLRTARRSSRFKPKIEVFEGKAGLRKGFERSLVCKEKVQRVFSSTREIFESLPEFLPSFVQKRHAAGIKMRSIHPDDEAAREMIRHHPNSSDQISLIPHEKFKLLPSDLAIFDDTVGFMSHKPPFCVLIQSREISEVLKVAFDLAEKEAKRYAINH
jgi:sugar-specific transcriptional regulator TrmB